MATVADPRERGHVRIANALGDDFEPEYMRGGELRPERYAGSGAVTRGAMSTVSPHADAAGRTRACPQAAGCPPHSQMPCRMCDWTGSA